MNENRIRQVLEIEKQAQEIQEQAKREAQEIPMRAEQEAQALVAKAIADAHEEARKMLAEAQSGSASTQAAAGNVPANSGFEELAKKNFDKAVAFILERVIGRA
jgi:vacuolar-type H+-ATPase subunit H